MKKSKIAVLSLALLSTSVFAASNNTIRFQGEVSDETCSVTVNGNDAKPVVLLPTVSVKDLDTSGKTAGQTNFTIGVSGCTGSTTGDVDIKTIFLANKITDENRIGNTADAKNVSLELIDPKDSSTLDLTGAGNAGLVLKKDETSASYDYAVRYHADDAVTAGKVEGSVQYSISYQ